jgi:hypothetical protein
VAANLEVAEKIGALAAANCPKRSGATAASIVASLEGEDALVGPTGGWSKNGPYGRAVELGGMRAAHNPSGYMWWPTGVWSHHAAANMMPSQPYLKPAAEEVVGSGDAERTYYEHWLKAQQAILRNGD